ncbi:MAG: arginine repressor [Clostridiales bacterium]|nr:arginine repressor [Clostridiales bacterium]MBD5100104.1 arginine repressor [Clostridiales bacterium]
MANSARQQALLDIVTLYEIDKQEDLVSILHERGFDVTQATISRDIKQLGLVKVAGSTKKYRYTQVHFKEKGLKNKYDNIFKECVLSLQSAGNIIVIKTVSGAANSAGAYLDNLMIPTILGTIAGDDTIICVATTEKDAQDTLKFLKDTF